MTVAPRGCRRKVSPPFPLYHLTLQQTICIPNSFSVPASVSTQWPSPWPLSELKGSDKKIVAQNNCSHGEHMLGEGDCPEEKMPGLCFSSNLQLWIFNYFSSNFIGI